jgi:pSer/pThr/pTyr-binding forkhead associated (FHA) protein
MTGIVVFILRIILAASLYVFIGIMFLTIWRQLKTQIKILSPEINNMLRLIPVDDEQFDTIEIKQAEVIVGRDPNNKIYISDETVSAQHCRIYISDQQWWINDLNSTNGTYLNDEIIDRPCVLTDGDMIMFGQVKFSIQVINTSG